MCKTSDERRIVIGRFAGRRYGDAGRLAPAEPDERSEETFTRRDLQGNNRQGKLVFKKTQKLRCMAEFVVDKRYKASLQFV